MTDPRNFSRSRTLGALLCGAALTLPALSSCGGKDSGEQDLCAELRPCGGDVLGTWQVDALCPDALSANELLGSQLPAACAGAVQSVNLPTYDLALEYTATTRTVTGTAALNATLTLTASCIGAVSPFPLTPSDSVCMLVGAAAVTQLRTNLPDAMLTCRLSGADCACDLTGTLTLDSTVNYTLSNNQIVEGDSQQDYCVSGDNLSLRSAQLGQLHARRQ